MEDEELAPLLELDDAEEDELLDSEDDPLDDELLGGWLLEEDSDDELDAELLELDGPDELLAGWLLDDAATGNVKFFSTRVLFASVTPMGN